MASGWIKIDRGITDHWIFKDAEKFKWWFELLLMANWEDKKVMHDSHLFTLKRGQMIASVSFLCQKWEKSNKTIIKFLHLLEQEGMITRSIVHRQTPIITICNYEKYQCDVQTNVHTQVHTQVHTIVHTNKEYKEYQEEEKDKSLSEKKEKNPKIFQPPSVEEVRRYCEERNNGIDAEAFVAFYESKGWMIGKNKMKNWKSAIVTWEKKRKNETQIVTLTPSQHGQYISTDDRRAEEKAKRIASGIALVNATLASNTPYEE